MQSANSPPPKPKRYYVAVTQQLAENSQTVRGVIKPNKNLRKNETEKTNQPTDNNPPNGTSNSNISHVSSSSSINNDSFYDDEDNLSDNRLYPSCYNRQKIVVAPLGKTTGHDPNHQSPTSKGNRSNRPK